MTQHHPTPPPHCCPTNKMKTPIRCSSLNTDSAPIPLPHSHIHRTHSELALDEANKMADWRESQMYIRLLTGMIRRSHEKGLDQHPKIIRSLENLMLTQASPISSLQPSSKLNEEWGVIGESCRSCVAENCSRHPSCTSCSRGSTWSSAMNGFSQQSSRLPSRPTLKPLDALKSPHCDEEGIFDLEM